MGVGPKISSSAIEGTREATPQPPNPDPKRAKIVTQEIHNGFMVAEVEYEGVTTFEGRKLMVFPKGVTSITLWSQRGIDPHFSDDPMQLHPIARFRPDDAGWRMARIVCWAS